MTVRRRPTFPALAVRIWLVTAAAALAAIAGLYLVARLASEPGPHGRLRRGGPYVTSQLAERWNDPAALAAEVTRVRSEDGIAAAAVAWDGAVRAAAPGVRTALDRAERARLATGGVLETGGRCGPGPCEIAFRVGPATAPQGYVVLTSADRHRPPGLWPIALLLLFLAAAAAVLGGAIARPLAKLAQTARALGGGDLRARTGIVRGDELGEVARAFDEMADRLVLVLRSHTELLANVAHELRTPLARIRVALDLADEGDTAVARESLAEIGADLGELERLVDDILASARIELAAGTAAVGGVPPLRRARLDVGAVARGAASRLAQRHPERPLELDLDGALPAFEGDATLLRRALDNLLDNAHEYSPAGKPVRLSATATEGSVRFAVADQGVGISPEDQARLFTPFFRADPSRTRATGGVGLGLSLARRIAEAHGGTLAVESAPGRGSTFTLTIPAPPPP